MHVELVEGFLDNLSDMIRDHDNSLIVLDDLMSQCSNDERLADLFTCGSHHHGISVSSDFAMVPVNPMGIW